MDTNGDALSLPIDLLRPRRRLHRFCAAVAVVLVAATRAATTATSGTASTATRAATAAATSGAERARCVESQRRLRHVEPRQHAATTHSRVHTRTATLRAPATSPLSVKPNPDYVLRPKLKGNKYPGIKCDHKTYKNSIVVKLRESWVAL